MPWAAAEGRSPRDLVREEARTVSAGCDSLVTVDALATRAVASANGPLVVARGELESTAMNTPRHVRRATGFLGLVLAIARPAGADLPTHAPPSVLSQPVTVTAAVRSRYTGVLPTWRRVAPVGTIASTPNFPTRVLSVGGDVLVLANGATPYQTVTWYDRQLRRRARLAAFSRSAPVRATVSSSRNGLTQAIDPRHPSAGGTVYAPAQAAPRRRVEALATATIDRSARRVPTTVVSHSDLFQGLAASADRIVYATGGNSDQVLALRIDGGRIAVVRRYPLQWQAFPHDQYPYTYQGEHGTKPYHFYPDSVAVGPQGHYLYVTGLLSNSLARIDRRTGDTRYVNVGPYPFAVVLADQGRRLAVSNWAGRGVTILDRRSLKVLGVVPTGPDQGPHTVAAGVHPTAMVATPDGPGLWVADANTDALVEIDTQSLKAMRVLADEPYPGAPPGSYPDALAIANGDLFVANAGNDDVAVFDFASGKSLGLIPTGWYPSALTIAGHSLYVVAAKGFGTGPNRHWQYIGNMMHGLLQKVPLQGLERALPEWTREALANDGFAAAERRALATRNARTAAFLRRRIQYVVFVLRENKTFDEDLGDYRAAGRWADPRFDLYGPTELPNLYHWAATEAVFANFMADGEVTAQGHQWTDGASDSDVVQRLWPEYYSRRGLNWNAGPGGTGSLSADARDHHDPFEYSSKTLGAFANPWISYPERLYLFNDLLAHRVSFEDFGENLTRARDGVIRDALLAHVDRTYPGWDRMIRDDDRVAAAIAWLRTHRGAAFPHFVFIWLPDDHTAGSTPCYYSPDYYVADNDHATARLLHYLAGTREWAHMAVFLDEDDAQSGADHLDAHRTLGLALGPWVKSGTLDTQPLSQVNIVRSIEAIFDLPPMSQWDANAEVIAGIWRAAPRLDPMPVSPMRVPVQFNRGRCSDQRLLRREAGATGHVPTQAWLERHRAPHGETTAVAAGQRYSPTSILKVGGPEQMRQEWIATRGARRYRAFQRFIRAYAASRGDTTAAYEANDGELR